MVVSGEEIEVVDADIREAAQRSSNGSYSVAEDATVERASSMDIAAFVEVRMRNGHRKKKPVTLNRAEAIARERITREQRHRAFVGEDVRHDANGSEAYVDAGAFLAEVDKGTDEPTDVLFKRAQAASTEPSDDGRWYPASEFDALVSALDVALNGDGAAPQAMLCDIVGQVENERRKITLPIIDALRVSVGPNEITPDDENAAQERAIQLFLVRRDSPLVQAFVEGARWSNIVARVRALNAPAAPVRDLTDDGIVALAKAFVSADWHAENAAECKRRCIALYREAHAKLGSEGGVR